jgi:ATP-binding cassette subfamily C (CFTR/MRP) protein 4
MDDPVSALDARVRRKVIENCLLGHLKGKTRILITHSIDFLSLADKIIIMNEGRISECGTFSSLKECEKFQKLLKMNDINKKETTLEEGMIKDDDSEGHLECSDSDCSDCEALKLD